MDNNKFYNVKLISIEKGFNLVIKCKKTQSILEAAEIAGIDLPYSCRSGACSTCVGKKIKGFLNQSDQLFLNLEQINNNFLLTCVSYPESDCEILVHQEDEIN
jgi:ferredoxin